MDGRFSTVHALLSRGFCLDVSLASEGDASIL